MPNLFEDPETFTSIAILVLVDQYTTEVLDWDLETITREVKEDFRVDINPAVLDKIAVGQLLLNTNMFHTSLPEFITFCNVMSNEEGLKGVWSPADSYEMTWAVAEEKLLVNEDEEFSADILAYITTILRDDGVVSPPDSLTFISPDNLAGPLINEVSYDPIIYQASYEEGTAISDNLQEYLAKQLDKWQKQLAGIQLIHGDVKKVLG